jgi:hypothetical protein
MNTRMQRLLTGACLMVALVVLAPQARAKAASFLELVPQDAPMVVYAPSYAQFEKKVDGVIESLGLLAPGMSDMRQQLGLQEGMDLDAPMGMVFLTFDPTSGEEPQMVMIAGVSDYDALVSAMGGDPAADITEMMMPMGERGYAKKLAGSFIAVGPDQASLEAFSPDMEAAKSRMKKLPASVLETAEKNAISMLIFDMEPIMQAYQQAMQMAMMMGGQGAMGQQAMEQQEAMMELAEQVEVMSLGMDSSQLGVSMNLAAGFKEGTELHGAAKKAKASKQLLRTVPAGEFLFAMGIDGKAMDLFKPFQKMAGNQPSMDAAWAMMEQTSGQETAIYIPPSGMFGGLLTKGVTINYSNNAEKAYQAATDAILEMDGTEQQGMKITTSLEAEGVELGQKAAKYGFNFIFPPEMAQAGQSMIMMFGGPGPRGYIVQTENAVVQTMGTDMTFAQQIIEAVSGEAEEPLGNAGAIQQIGKMLPSDRVAEGYIGMEAVTKMLAPMAGMFLGAPLEVPAEMPPIGFAMTVDNGAAGGSAFVPMQLMVSIKEMIEDLQQATQEMEQMEQDGGGEDFPF